MVTNTGAAGTVGGPTGVGWITPAAATKFTGVDAGDAPAELFWVPVSVTCTPSLAVNVPLADGSASKFCGGEPSLNVAVLGTLVAEGSRLEIWAVNVRAIVVPFELVIEVKAGG